MIAKNYTRFPEALRFQVEMFSNGYHNSPRIMRLVECIFDWTPSTPAWWTECKGRARSLAKQVRKAITDLFTSPTNPKTPKPGKKGPKVVQLALDLAGPEMTLKMPANPPLDSVPMSERWTPRLRQAEDDPDCMGDRAGYARMAGFYANYCRKKYGYQGHARLVGSVKAYWGGFSQ